MINHIWIEVINDITSFCSLLLLRCICCQVAFI
jgi:hypothetical protein